MKYIVKKSGLTTKLTPIVGKYMVKFQEGFDGESIVSAVNKAERFQYSKVVAKDSLALISFDIEAEKTQTFKRLMDDIQKDDTVEAVLPAFRDQENFERYIVPRKVLVCHRPSNQNDFIQALGEEFTIFKKSLFGNWTLVNTPFEKEISEYINHFNSMEIIEVSEPAYYGINDAENSSIPAALWNINNINLESAWRITHGTPNILIAIIDGRPDLSHDVFRDANITDIPTDHVFSTVSGLSSHCTQILGLLAGKNGAYSGIAPDASFLPLVVTLEAQYYAERAEAIFFLEQIMKNKSLNGKPVSRIIANCSWKTAGDVEIIREAIQAAVEAGVIFITSAGNENTDGAHYPSDYSRIMPGVISVAALTPENTKAEYSNYSAIVDIAAPGGDGLPFDSRDIYCPDVNNTFQYTAGTSISAPHVSGALALILSVNSGLSADEIRLILKDTAGSIQAENPEKWQFLGAGKLDVGRAVSEVLNHIEKGLTKPDTSEIPVSPQRCGDESGFEQPGDSDGTTADYGETPDEQSPKSQGPQISVVLNNAGTDESDTTLNEIDLIVQTVLQRIIPEIRTLIQETAQLERRNLSIRMELSSFSVMLTITL